MAESSKYEYSFTIKEADVQKGETSHAKLLQMVLPGSTVLECGPSHGIMTRYLKENLHCKIFILEIDLACYEHALQYADGGICADLEDDCWMCQLEESSFDYIIYADVLEHLRDPEQVLAKMKRFLKPDGAVLLSVPNVANGDIIANLLCDRFTYTPLGLLDNTHIHLFARENLRNMICTSGYHLAYEGCTTVPMFFSEQGQFIPEERRPALKQVLIGHPTCRIYQYICRLTQSEVELVSEVECYKRAIQMSETELYGGRVNTSVLCRTEVFFDTGNGFREEESECQYHPYNEDFEFCVPIGRNVKNFRIDPTDGYAIVAIKKCCAVSDEGIFDLPYRANGILIGNVIMFDTDDPQIWFHDLKDGVSEVRIVLNTVQITVDVIENYGRLYYSAKGEQQRLNQQLIKMDAQLQTKEDECSRLKQRCSDADVELQSWKEKNMQLNGQVTTVNAELQVRTAENERLNEQLLQVAEAYHAISSAFFWKITKPLRVVLDYIKRLLKQA